MDMIQRRSTFTLLLLYAAAMNAAGQIFSSVPTINRFTLDQDSSGIMASAIRNVGDTPSLVCSAQSNTRPVSIALRRERDGKVLADELDLELTFTFEPLVCEDTGAYVCIVHNRANTKKTRMDLSVLCPPQLITDNTQGGADFPFYSGSVGSDLTIQLDVVGLPAPSRLLLTTANTETVLASRILNGEGDKAVDYSLERFEFEYVPATKPFGSVELLIKDLRAEDVGRIYCLVVENEKKERMRYVFMVTQAGPTPAPTTPPTTTGETTTLPPPPPPPQPSSLNIQTLALGVALLVVDVAIAVVVAGLVYRRCSKNRRLFVSMIEKRETTRRQRRILRRENPRLSETTVSQPVSFALSEIQTYGDGVYSLQSMNLSDHPRYGAQQQQPRPSQDFDERFSQDFQPQGRSTDSNGEPHRGIENIYYVPGEDPRNERSPKTAVPLTGNKVAGDSPVNRNNISSGIPKDGADGGGGGKDSESNANLKSEERISAMYAKVNKSKNSARSANDELYNNVPNPDDAMLEAERKIANGASGREFVVLGQHRKLSLPKDDLEIYQHF